MKINVPFIAMLIVLFMSIPLLLASLWWGVGLVLFITSFFITINNTAYRWLNAEVKHFRIIAHRFNLEGSLPYTPLISRNKNFIKLSWKKPQFRFKKTKEEKETSSTTSLPPPPKPFVEPGREPEKALPPQNQPQAIQQRPQLDRSETPSTQQNTTQTSEPTSQPESPPSQTLFGNSDYHKLSFAANAGNLFAPPAKKDTPDWEENLFNELDLDNLDDFDGDMLEEDFFEDGMFEDDMLADDELFNADDLEALRELDTTLQEEEMSEQQEDNPFFAPPPPQSRSVAPPEQKPKSGLGGTLMPKMPKFSRPKMPTFSKPKLPQFSRPKLPKVKVPKFSLPSRPNLSWGRKKESEKKRKSWLPSFTLKVPSLEFELPFHVRPLGVKETLSISGYVMSKPVNIQPQIATTEEGFDLPQVHVTIQNISHQGIFFTIAPEKVDFSDPNYQVVLMEDQRIRDILHKAALPRQANIRLHSGQLTYQENSVLRTDKERLRFERVLVMLFIIIDKVERMTL